MSVNLEAGSILRGRYVIADVLSALEEDVILYRGRDNQTGHEVRIYEYFPPSLAQRASDGKTVRLSGASAEDYKFGLRLFQEESDLRSQFTHEHLQLVLEAFEDHGTSYRVFLHEAGTTLLAALERRAGTLSEAAARQMFLPIVDALSAAHEIGLTHGGICPESIYLTKERQTYLQGFRGASLRLARRLGRSVELAIPGISPLEQYEVGREFTPAGDLYCVAASIFQVITGRTLPEAPVRVPNVPIRELTYGSGLMSDGMRDVLHHALALSPEDRIQDAKVFRDMLADPGHVDPPSHLRTGEDPNPTQEDANFKSDQEIAGSTQSSVTPYRNALDDVPPPEIPPVGEAYPEDQETEPVTPDREPVAEEPDAARYERGSSAVGSVLDKGPSTLLMAAGIAGVVLIVGILAILFGSEYLGERSNEMSQLAALTAEADSLMARRNYSAARSRYARAMELEEAQEADIDAYLEQRLRQVQQQEEAQKAELYRDKLSQGRSHQVHAIALAESGAREEAAREFEAAYDAFMAAWDTYPQDSLALDLAQAVGNQAEDLSDSTGDSGDESRGTTQEEAIENTEDRLFEHHATAGAAHVEAGNYTEAQTEFEQALVYRPDSQQALNQLEEIVSLLDDQEQEDEFTAHVHQGEGFLEQGQLTMARRAFQRALSYRHDSVVEQYIAQIDSQLAAEEEAHQQFYAHRARGDLLFEEGRYADAAASYQQALAIDPDDSHASARLRASEQSLAEMEAKEERPDGRKREDGVYILTDLDPQLIGTMQELHDEVDYPRRAARNGIEGRVIMQFVVEEDGTVSNPQVLRGIGGGADEEALRVISGARFEPAQVDGEPVRAQHTKWIQFRLDNR